ncbi:M48 family metallopeptidase [Paracraurococcus lichenis]|uniref:M48 family metallopeptidase n=1 Tax=Paracraurococcus lichenis TaxID=3064888 RepID=A0ABT9E2J2_9PROT|nr:M48 family metallopeptidase [Paracraurococcus sp. LOR1-02]MDO9710369.1 M48 family metallopeptidase [Paracraurococcus sp. LOR1-02]
MQQTEAETVALPGAASGGVMPETLACPVRWRRSSRARRVSLRIDARAGEVVVTLPPRAHRRAGMALLTTHAAWVRERLAALAPHIPFAPGSELPLGGLRHVIRHDPGAAPGVVLAAGAVLVGGPEARLPAQIGAFLKAEAQRRIRVLAAGHAALLGVSPKAIRLKDTRSRWGSCAPDGTLAFSWRLVMAPDWVLDYVVAHEVAHLKELNHSPRFWALVERLTPHRDAAVEWLRVNGPALLRVG